MPAILVLDGNQRSALAIVRSLGRRQLTVFSGEETADSLCAASRYVRQALVYPSPRDDAEAFMTWVIGAINTQNIDLVIPATDITTNTLALFRDRLPAHVVLPDLPAYESLTDKFRLLDLCCQVGIPTPASVIVDVGGVEISAWKGGWPAILKPTRSKYFRDGRWISTAVRPVASAAEASAVVAQADYPMMLQQFIEGHGAGVFALYDHGKAVSFFAHRRLREKPPGGGVSVLSESAQPDPKLTALVKQLLDAAGWHGVAMVEFRVTPDGTPYIMEVNTRFWGSLQLAVDSGVDFPYWLTQIGLSQLVDVPDSFQSGKQLRWYLGDLDNLLITLKSKAYTRRQKLRAVVAFLVPHPRAKHEIFRWDDPRPALFELRSYVRGLIR